MKEICFSIKEAVDILVEQISYLFLPKDIL